MHALGLSLIGNDQFYPPLLNEFNKYSKKNKLNINVELITLSEINSTASSSPIDYVLLLGNLYQKKIIKYDIVIYFNFYLDGYDKFFVNLYNYFEDDHINMFDPEILSLTCIINKKLVGLV